jgi:hypothetical protein
MDMQTNEPSLVEVMANVRRGIVDRLTDSLVTHKVCKAKLDSLTNNVVRIADIPTGVSFFYQGTFHPVHVAEVQLTTYVSKPTTRHPKERYYAIAEWARPLPVRLGVVWMKPYVRLIPMAGLTVPEWQSHFPPFHYVKCYDSQTFQVCVGETFKIGEVHDPVQGLPGLTKLLSVYNAPGAYSPFINITELFPNPLWSWWDAAFKCLDDDLMSEDMPQSVFTPLWVCTTSPR